MKLVEKINSKSLLNFVMEIMKNDFYIQNLKVCNRSITKADIFFDVDKIHLTVSLQEGQTQYSENFYSHIEEDELIMELNDKKEINCQFHVFKTLVEEAKKYDQRLDLLINS